MEPRDRSAVLTIAANFPPLAFRLGLQYLRVKRSANRARNRFYKELVRSGLPRNQAKDLADQYVSAVSIRSIMNAVGAAPLSKLLERGGD